MPRFKIPIGKVVYPVAVYADGEWEVLTRQGATRRMIRDLIVDRGSILALSSVITGAEPFIDANENRSYNWHFVQLEEPLTDPVQHGVFIGFVVNLDRHIEQVD